MCEKIQYLIHKYVNVEGNEICISVKYNLLVLFVSTISFLIPFLFVLVSMWKCHFCVFCFLPRCWFPFFCITTDYLLQFILLKHCVLLFWNIILSIIEQVNTAQRLRKKGGGGASTSNNLTEGTPSHYFIEYHPVPLCPYKVILVYFTFWTHEYLQTVTVVCNLTVYNVWEEAFSAIWEAFWSKMS